ncbi:MAG: phosphotransferase [Chloroflexota bacterium]
MQKGELIAEGRTAEVYAWGGSRVLKLYRPDWPLENIEYEIKIGRIVYDAGVAAPFVGDLIEVDGRRGLIYERIDGAAMDSVLLKRPQRADEIARLFAHLHLSLHRSSATDLPLQRRRLIRQIEQAASSSALGDTRKQFALDTLATLPDGGALCHGDLHPGNVLMSPDGPRIIDWENATTGSPLADVARTSLVLQTAHLTLDASILTEPVIAAIERFRQIYLNEYIARSGANRTLIDAWHIPVAAARLHEGITTEESFLLALCTPPTMTEKEQI